MTNQISGKTLATPEAAPKFLPCRWLPPHCRTGVYAFNNLPPTHTHTHTHTLSHILIASKSLLSLPTTSLPPLVKFLDQPLLAIICVSDEEVSVGVYLTGIIYTQYPTLTIWIVVIVKIFVVIFPFQTKANNSPFLF